jgi:hypothetical protein
MFKKNRGFLTRSNIQRHHTYMHWSIGTVRQEGPRLRDIQRGRTVQEGSGPENLDHHAG